MLNLGQIMLLCLFRQKLIRLFSKYIVSNMAPRATRVAAALALLLLLAPRGLAWYKPAAGPSHYSVGRAAGLLSGFRGSPFAVGTGPQRRAGASAELRPGLRSLAVCVQDVSPDLRSCERLPDGGTFQCKADVFLSLRAAGCRGA